mmetsp:Transcript_54327/g.125128  ORF Transcript_54327/g.125128 Transcript_54327/m.125128 type:complete len:308 (-) Transcript_54327:213-1136(-)|eukprot:CAMPEP_0119362016 /NCGR_PEP_ID=MMETSP1334-20130426/9201_1 /TAXON_ID=127549 /ORGANISM="Calcidiscus leptoporus, Strain RCC1130" /LENGTH=307 /DNA_ID=CAMNT_0007377171 /DNA_START=167 /DNA_END=1090 /DNA_ORIENTATION=-
MLGIHTAAAAIGRGWKVCGTTRARSARSEELLALGVCTFTCGEDGLPADALHALTECTHLLVTAPPACGEDQLLRFHREDLVADSARLRWLGYLSTTSVYGDHGGQWVDEASETRAASGSSGEVRLRAESSWRSLHSTSGGRLRVNVFRLAGIYGPGRSAIDTVQRALAEPLPAPAVAEGGECAVPQYVSRVHVRDISDALLASMEKAADTGADTGGCTYNVADCLPVPRAEVLSYAAELLRAPPTETWAGAAQGSGARAVRRARENKRVDNGKLLSELLVGGLVYPSYREGLRAIHDRSRARRPAS